MERIHENAAGPGTAAFHRLRHHLKELQEYFSLLVSAQKDKMKVGAQKGAMAGALGALGLLFGGGLVVTFGVMIAFYFFAGLAGGLGRLCGDQLWLGQLVLSVLFLALLAGGGFYGFVKYRKTARESLVDKYEKRKEWEQSQFGHDISQQSHE